MSTVIKVENLSKQYRLGEFGSSTISSDLNRWWHIFRGKEDPYLKVGELNNRTVKGNSDYVWALKDINFNVKQGEILGILGQNGAGKSTLLKLLSRVTSPTTGSIKVKGRIASLLEVGTGFHDELTGRENVFLNGAILGMTKSEIRFKFDEIVDFSGTERYIDTPVKRYSSGMRVRLAFAVAAHLEPEILIVDEVLAVGDADFQSKAIGKMQEVSNTSGRTVLFVSHNMGSLKSLCTRGLLLSNGKVTFEGDINATINTYLQNNLFNSDFSSLENRPDRNGNGKLVFSKFLIQNEFGEQINSVLTGESCFFNFTLKLNEKCNNIDLGFSIHTLSGEMVSVLYSSYYHRYYATTSNDTYYTIRCKLPNTNLATGKYHIYGRVLESGLEADWPKFPLGELIIERGDFYKTGHLGFSGNTQLLIEGEWV